MRVTTSNLHFAAADHHCGAPAMTNNGLSEGAERLGQTFAVLTKVHEQVALLATVRSRRHWTAEEHDRYVALLGAQRRAVRGYLAAHRIFDAVRRGTWEAEATADREMSGLGSWPAT